MNQDRRARYIERAALREAQKAMRREGKASFTRDEILQLRIQSVEPWKRALLALPGGALAGTGVYVLCDRGAQSGIVLLMLGAILLLIGLLGRRRTVETCLDAVGNELASGVIEAIFNALDGF